MMRRRAGTAVPLALVLGSLAGVAAGTDGTASTADATIPASTQPSPSDPVVLGGRLEVPSAGFAITVPEGWYAYDVTHPDLASHLATFDEMTAFDVDLVDHMREMNWASSLPEPDRAQGAVYALPSVLGPDPYQSCVVTFLPSTDPLDVIFDAVVTRLRAAPWLDGEVDHGYVDLPVGRAGRARYTMRGLDREGPLVFSTFVLAGHNRAFDLTCESGVPHHDEWLAIAQTWEWLPTEAEPPPSPPAKK